MVSGTISWAPAVAHGVFQSELRNGLPPPILRTIRSAFLYRVADILNFFLALRCVEPLPVMPRGMRDGECGTDTIYTIFLANAKSIIYRRGRTGSGTVILPLFRTSGIAQGIFQPEGCHGPSHPFLRTIRSAPRDGLAGLLHFLLRLRLLGGLSLH